MLCNCQAFELSQEKKKHEKQILYTYFTFNTKKKSLKLSKENIYPSNNIYINI